MDLIVEAVEIIVATTLDVLPIVVFLVFFHRVVLGRKLPNLDRIMIGFGLVVAGLGLFLLGLEKALFPLGRLMAEQLATARRSTPRSMASYLAHTAAGARVCVACACCVRRRVCPRRVLACVRTYD